MALCRILPRHVSRLHPFVVDMDAQGNATSTLLNSEDFTGTRSEELFSPELEKINVQHCLNKVDLIGSSLDDDSGYDTESLPLELAAQPKIHIDKIRDQYDFILIDCPPSLGRRLLSALLATDYVVCPVKLSGYAVLGLSRLFSTLIKVKNEFNPDLGILGAIINEYDGSASHRKALESVKEILGDRVFTHYIRHRPPIDTASCGMPIWEVPNGQRAAQELAAVYNELLKRIKDAD